MFRQTVVLDSDQFAWQPYCRGRGRDQVPPLWFAFTTNTFAEGSNIFVSESKSSDKGLAVSNTGAVNPSAKLLQQVHFR